MFKLSKPLLAGTAAALFALAAQAHDYQAGSIAIGHPYARSTVPAQVNGGAFLSLKNEGSSDDKLIGVSGDVAGSVELHEMAMEGNVMKMRQVDGVALPAGKTVMLAPGGYHVMLLGLKAPLKQGDSFPLKLTFEKAGTTTVTVDVEGAAADHSKH
ncbi:MAG: copper chaperone PCu(A)C [Proteobacteria bacterium]|nr:copper chaperone PCu(A)C [Pseudomonadota bacterium]